MVIAEWIKYVAKAIAAAATAVGAQIVAVSSDGITGSEIGLIVTAGIVAFAAVWTIPNGDKPEA